MKFSDYQAQARRTFPATIDTHERLILALGLCDEAGEVAEGIKRHHGNGRPLDAERLTAELGDVLWYLAAIATAYGLDLDHLAKHNLAMLRRRYPVGIGERDGENAES
jgi:NTP pyrophosphatase (non-canonical NTP hydrolase)